MGLKSQLGSAMSLEVSVNSALYRAGLTEDGEDFVGYVFFVQVTAPDGRRWVHGQTYDGVRCEPNEWTGADDFVDVRDAASASAEKLASKVRAHLASGGQLDPVCWNQVDPVYASDAYESLDSLGYFKAQEKQREYAH